MLDEVKKCLGITGEFQDSVIQSWIDEIQNLMIDGGISSSIAKRKTSAGVIAKGIDDIYFQKGELSTYFWQRAVQLSCKESTETVIDDGNVIIVEIDEGE